MLLAALTVLLVPRAAWADDDGERTSVDITVVGGMGMAMVDGDAAAAFGPQIAVGRGLSRFSVEGQYQLSLLASDKPGGISGWSHRAGVMGQYSMWGDRDTTRLKDRFRGYLEVGVGRQWVDVDDSGAVIARNHGSLGAAIDMRARVGSEERMLMAVHLGMRVDLAGQPGPGGGVDVSTAFLIGSGISW